MEYIFTIPVEDVQYLAKKKFGRDAIRPLLIFEK